MSTNETRPGKTPEEIKYAVENCHYAYGCNGCAYREIHQNGGDCGYERDMDLIAYLQQLENDLKLKDSVTSLIKIIQEYDDSQKQRITDLLNELDQSEKEKCLIIEQIQKLRDCDTCVYIKVPIDLEPCASCLSDGNGKPYWKWECPYPQSMKEEN